MTHCALKNMRTKLEIIKANASSIIGLKKVGGHLHPHTMVPTAGTHSSQINVRFKTHLNLYTPGTVLHSTGMH